MWLRHAEQTHLRFMLRSLLPPKTLENTAAFIEQRSALAAGLRVSDALGEPIAMNVVSTCYSLSNLFQHYRLQKCAFLRFIRFVLVFFNTDFLLKLCCC